MFISQLVLCYDNFISARPWHFQFFCYKVECFSPRTNVWTPCPSLIKRKGSLAGATSRSKLFAIGGGNGSECFSDVEMFDPALGRWINSPSMFQKVPFPHIFGLRLLGCFFWYSLLSKMALFLSNCTAPTWITRAQRRYHRIFCSTLFKSLMSIVYWVKYDSGEH